MQERAEVVKNNRDEMEGLFDKRSSAEQAFLERYMAAAEAYERQLEDLRCADAEDYNLLKVRCALSTQCSNTVCACEKHTYMWSARGSKLRTANVKCVSVCLLVASQIKCSANLSCVSSFVLMSCGHN